MDTTTLIGVLGGLIVVTAFLLNNTKRVTTESFSYDLLNVVGSALLIWYAILLNSIPFAILNIVWGGASLWDVVKYLRSRKV